MCLQWAIYAPAACLSSGSRLSGSLSGIKPEFPVTRKGHCRPLHNNRKHDRAGIHLATQQHNWSLCFCQTTTDGLNHQCKLPLEGCCSLYRPSARKSRLQSNQVASIQRTVDAQLNTRQCASHTRISHPFGTVIHKVQQKTQGQPKRSQAGDN
jgi:hypothetical protein